MSSQPKSVPTADSLPKAGATAPPFASLSEAVRLVAASHPFSTGQERCVALHDFVRDEIDFGFTTEFESVTPERTLELRRGHCNAQADLFRALLHEAGIAAQLRFVQLDKAILRYAIPDPIYFLLPRSLFHAVTQVRLANAWLNTDSYIFDCSTFGRQRNRLVSSGLRTGFGLAQDATCRWDATGNAFSQASADILTAHDPVFPSLQAAIAAHAGGNTLFGLHFNQWLSCIPHPIGRAWSRYVNGRL